VKEILDTVQRWRAKGERAAIATVVATRRSAPRPVGAKLAVSESGELAGSVSGGCVESDVYLRARQVIETAEPRLLSYGLADEDACSIGLPCGGEIDVFVQALEDSDVTDQLLRTVEQEKRGALFTVIDGVSVGERLLVLDDGQRAGDGVPESVLVEVDDLLVSGRSRLLETDGIRVFADLLAPPPRLVIYGAGETAEAICAAARLLGWRTVVIDARAAFATRERVPSADELVQAWPEDAAALREADRGTAIVVLTHDEKFDVLALKTALASDAFYIGALGSRSNQERRRVRLLQLGVGVQGIARITGPCGLDIGGESQPETALSILAEIVAVQAGRSGGRLRHGDRRIHSA